MLPPHEVVKVDLKDRSYNIIIGDGLFPQFGKFIKTIFSGGRVVIISDTNVTHTGKHIRI